VSKRKRKKKGRKEKRKTDVGYRRSLVQQYACSVSLAAGEKQTLQTGPR
jgi:hypothetical protein